MESPFFCKRSNPELWSGNTDSMTRDYPRTPNPREYQLVRIPIKATTCKQDQGMTQLATALYAACLIQTTNKAKIQTQPSAERVTTLHSSVHQRGKKKTLTFSHQNVSTSHTLHKAYTSHWTKLKRAKTKKEERIQPHCLVKGNLNYNKLKK